MQKIAGKPNSLSDVPFHYCPGCTHGIIHRLITETIDELNLEDRIIAVEPVGCAVVQHNYFNFDTIQAAHGRAPAVATGVKRTNPDKIVFTYQGDGDLAAIGTAEIIHAASRGEKFTTFFVNNAIYGMTGGQMAPTTLPGQTSTTTPGGRLIERAGNPIRVSEMLSTLYGPAYIERVAVDSPQNIRKAKQAIKRAFQVQLAGLGFSFVEILSSCPTNWGLSPLESLDWIGKKMVPFYPLKQFLMSEGVE
jgi:2-oxoglutarate ferredoxin oxidoreductase subunit beta